MRPRGTCSRRLPWSRVLFYRSQQARLLVAATSVIDVHDSIGPLDVSVRDNLATTQGVPGTPDFKADFVQADFSSHGAQQSVALAHAKSARIDVGTFTNDIVGATEDNTGKVTSPASYVNLPAFLVTLTDVPVADLQVARPLTQAGVAAEPSTQLGDYHFLYDAFTHRLLLAF